MFPIINLGPLSLPAPAFILLLGFFAGSYLLDKKASSFLMDSEIIDRALWIGVPSGFIGARVSFILRSPAAFRGDLMSIISLNPALLDPESGFLIGIAAVFLIISRQKADYWRFLDSLTPFLGTFLPFYFFSRFASGNGYGIVTDLPWGIFLWGAVRHPVQLYFLVFAVVILIFVLIYAPIKDIPSGSSFLIFSAATFSYLLFCVAFQEQVSTLIAGFRPDQMIFWIGLLAFLVLLNYRINTASSKVRN